MNVFFNSVIVEFLGEVVRGGDDFVGIIGMIDHEAPHFGFGDGVC